MSSTERPEDTSRASETSSPGSSLPVDRTPDAVNSHHRTGDRADPRRLMPKRRRASRRRPLRPLLRSRERRQRAWLISYSLSTLAAAWPLASMRFAKTSRHSSNSLSQGGPNNAAPVRDWRGKVVGFRDIEAAQGEGLPWIVDNSFVTDANALKAQLAALEAAGGGDEPEVAARRPL